VGRKIRSDQFKGPEHSNLRESTGGGKQKKNRGTNMRHGVTANPKEKKNEDTEKKITTALQGKVRCEDFGGQEGGKQGGASLSRKEAKVKIGLKETQNTIIGHKVRRRRGHMTGGKGDSGDRDPGRKSLSADKFFRTEFRGGYSTKNLGLGVVGMLGEERNGRAGNGDQGLQPSSALDYGKKPH